MFKEIDNWARILNESAENEKFEAESRERACKEAKELEEKELADVETIDLDTLGLTKNEMEEIQEESEQENEDEIDFSVYGVNEADDREPVSHTLDPIGVKASTANLKSQDSTEISLVEAVKSLAEAVKELKSGKEADKIDEESLKSFDGLNSQKFNLQNKKGTISNCIATRIDKLTPEVFTDQKTGYETVKSWFKEDGIDTPKSNLMLAKIGKLPQFKDTNKIISYLLNTMQKGAGNSLNFNKFHEAEMTDEAAKLDLSQKAGTISNCIKNHVAELTPEVLKDQATAAALIEEWFKEDGIDTPKSNEIIKRVKFLPQFKNVNQIISLLVNTMEKGSGNSLNRHGYGFRKSMYEADENDQTGDELPDTTDDYEDFPSDEEYANMVKRARTLADKDERPDGLTPTETKELDELLKKLGLEKDEVTSLSRTLFAPTKNAFVTFDNGRGGTTQTYDTHSTVDADGKPGEHYIGPVPGFNADVDADKHKNRQQNRIQARKDAERKEREQKVLHPTVPERGKQNWALEDWNKVISNFDDKEKKELEAALMADADGDGNTQGMIRDLFGHKMTDSDWAKVFGVGNSTITMLVYKILHRFEDAMIKTKFCKPDFVKTGLDAVRAGINQYNQNLKRFNELVDIYNATVSKIPAKADFDTAEDYFLDIDGLTNKERDTLWQTYQNGVKKLKYKKEMPMFKNEKPIRDAIIIKALKAFQSKASDAQMHMLIELMKIQKDLDRSGKINNELSREEKKEYADLRKKVVSKNATDDEVARFKALVAKKKGEVTPDAE